MKLRSTAEEGIVDATTAGTVEEIATIEDEQEAVATELQAAGVSSLDELADQARRGEFSSERARRAWFTLAPLDQDWGSC